MKYLFLISLLLLFLVGCNEEKPKTVLSNRLTVTEEFKPDKAHFLHFVNNKTQNIKFAIIYFESEIKNSLSCSSQSGPIFLGKNIEPRNGNGHIYYLTKSGKLVYTGVSALKSPKEGYTNFFKSQVWKNNIEPIVKLIRSNESKFNGKSES